MMETAKALYDLSIPGRVHFVYDSMSFSRQDMASRSLELGRAHGP
jgi:hypothetical protein